jgi:Na(+)/H(+) antiporter nhaA 2
MNAKGWIIFSIIIVALLGGLIWLQNSKKEAVTTTIGEHTAGNQSAKVTLEEYGDYQCPGCGQVEPTIAKLRKDFGDKVQFIFRNFPLASYHPNARAAAAAAEAAGLQGKFWEMHDALYGNQSAWQDLRGTKRDSYFENQAQALGLNLDQFKSDIKSDNVIGKINSDVKKGKDQGVDATPNFYLNGRKLSNDDWNNEANLRSAIQKAVDEASK